jgi:hypothetical protein
MRIHLGSTFSDPGFPPKYLPTDRGYYQVVLQDDLIYIKVSSVRLVAGRDESIGGRKSGRVEIA